MSVTVHRAREGRKEETMATNQKSGNDIVGYGTTGYPVSGTYDVEHFNEIYEAGQVHEPANPIYRSQAQAGYLGEPIRCKTCNQDLSQAPAEVR